MLTAVLLIPLSALLIGQPPRPCPVSADPEFGFSAAKPIPIGGGALYVAAREQRYLQGLRGPAGELLSFKRTGSMMPPGSDAGRPLDRYTVTYDGLESPLTLYLDAYHYEPPRAPAGLVCAEDRLGAPPVDVFLAGEQVAALAARRGAELDLAPIPLSPDGATTYGVAFDRFRLQVRRARAAAAAGKPVDAGDPPADFKSRALMLVAYPLACGDRTVSPREIRIVPRQGPPVPRQGDLLRGEALARATDGFASPDGSLGAAFQLATFRPVDTVVIEYDGEVCAGGSDAVRLPVRMTAMRGTQTPQPELPAGAARPDGDFWFQFLVDHEGALQEIRYLGYPHPLSDAARAALQAWRGQPATINGAPIVVDSLAFIRFR